MDFARLYAVYFSKDLEMQLKRNSANLINLGVYSDDDYSEGKIKRLKNIFEVNFYKEACKFSLERIEMIIEKLDEADEDIEAAELEILLS